MAIAFDAASVGVPAFYFPTCTFAHTCAGADRVLFVAYQGDNGAADLVTGITYNGVALTQAPASPFLFNNNRWIGLWYLANPALGANNVVITVSANSVLVPVAWSYTGATAPPPVGATATRNPVGNMPMPITTTIDQSWVVGAAVCSGGGLTAGAATTERANNVGNCCAYDGNAAVSPAGLSTINVVLGAINADGIVVELPAAGGGGGGGGVGWPRWW